MDKNLQDVMMLSQGIARNKVFCHMLALKKTYSNIIDIRVFVFFQAVNIYSIISGKVSR